MQQAWQAATKVISKLEENGFEAVFVGGAVRDHLMKRPFHDVDVATSALPLEVKALFRHTIDIGIEHGTILVMDEGEPIEVTTYRTETTYSDFRRPDGVNFVRSLKEDMQRRDFTMNAIAMRGTGEIVDYFQGQRAIVEQRIEAVGQADERFTEDALRMLRAARFQAQLGFEIEQQTFQAIKNQAHLMTHIAMERIAQELSKLLIGAHVSKALLTIEETGMEAYLPGVFYSEKWTGVQFESEQQAWAYIYCLNQQEYPDVLIAYKSSNKIKAYAKMIGHLVEQSQWTVELIFDHSLDVLAFAHQVKTYLGKQTISFEKIKRIKQSLPIQSMQELAVTGQQIVEWSNGQKGVWIKERLTLVKQAVLTKKVSNTREQIKEWYDATFNEG